MLNKNPKLNKKDFQNKENFALIDIFKLFFALCIVGLHTGFLYNYAFGYYVHTIIFRLGVPFFFIASGYFLAKKDVGTNQKNICLDFIKKLLPMYLLLGTTYIILFAIRYNDFSASSLLINFWYLITGRSLSVMWYVGALITSAIILLHLNTKKKLLYSLILFLVLYIIGLLFNTYSFLLINGTFDFIYRFLVTQFHSNSNFLFVGFLFFGIGYYISKYELPNFIRNNKNRGLLMLFSLLLLIFESILIKRYLDVVSNYEYFFGHLLLIPTLFLFLTNSKLKFNTTGIRKLSTNIYYFHFIIILLLLAINKLYTNSFLNNPNIFYLSSVVLTIIFSLFYQKMFDFLKKMKKKEV